MKDVLEELAAARRAMGKGSVPAGDAYTIEVRRRYDAPKAMAAGAQIATAAPTTGTATAATTTDRRGILVSAARRTRRMLAGVSAKPTASPKARRSIRHPPHDRKTQR